MNSNKFLYAFAIAAIVCLIGRLMAEPLNIQLDYLSKPLLMPLLYLHFRQATNAKSTVSQALLQFVGTGIFFAWLGDVFLMLAHGDQLLFLLGLGGFLMMQMLYIKLYQQYSEANGLVFKSKFYLALPSLVIGIGFYALLYPNLGPVLKVAVGLYACALVGMTLGAINRLSKCNSLSFVLVTIGAFSFMFSDMMIGMKSFLPQFKDFPLASFWIMLTYILGQFLIIQGLIVQHLYQNRK